MVTFRRVSTAIMMAIIVLAVPLGIEEVHASNGAPPCVGAHCPALADHGGPLLRTASVYLVTFATRGATALAPGLVAGFGSTVDAITLSPQAQWWETEYGVGRAHYAGHISLRSRTLGTARLVSDGQIVTALADGRAYGKLPSGNGVLYVVATRAGQVVTYPGPHGQENSTYEFCGYHSFTSGYTGPNYPYIVLPNETGQPFCESGLSPVDLWVYVLAHEVAETMTDPYGNGWASGGRGGNEIADLCEKQLPSGMTNWNGGTYYFPLLFDNRHHYCRRW